MTTSILRSLTRAARGSRGAHSRDAAERAAPPVIALADVGMTYPNGKTALSDVSVEIPERDFVFLVGQSGAGKSTFIRLLIREQVATTGRVIVAGRDLGRLRRRQVPALRRRIGIVFQDLRLLPQKTVHENVAFALEVTGAPGRRIRTRVPQLLSLVGLQDHAHHLPTQLSGGEQQRVAIARALVHDPAILIADEPTGNLDPVTSWEIIQLLIHINELGTTVLMATHNQEIVNAMRRRVLALEHGRLVRDETSAAYEREY
jgi:cell division transport system ATP-binding protein